MNTLNPRVREALASEIVVRFAEALHGAGCSAHRLEESVGRVALAFGMEADVLALPTGVLLSLQAGQVTRLLRRPPGRYHVERQIELFRFAEEVNREGIEPKDALGRFEEIVNAPNPWSRKVRILSNGLAGALFALYLEGGWNEALLGAAVGLTCGLMLTAAEFHHRLERMPELLAAVAAAAVAGVLGLWLPCCQVIAILGGMLLMLPGMAFTVAVAEMANRNLLAGSIRLASSAWTLVAMVFGAALGGALPDLFGTVLERPPETLGLAAKVACLPLVALVLTVHLQARKREWAWILAACSLALLASHFCRAYLAVEWLGSFLAALSVGVLANFCSRWRGTPSAALTLAALYLLVPGTIGYRGVIALASGDMLHGLEMGLSMALRGIGLVAGLVFSSLLLPPLAPSSRRQGTHRALWHSERL